MRHGKTSEIVPFLYGRGLNIIFWESDPQFPGQVSWRMMMLTIGSPGE
jgi:hypothetical protein